LGGWGPLWSGIGIGELIPPNSGARGAHRHKIYVVGHDLRELMAVVLIKGGTESLWQIANGLLIQLRLSAGGPDGSQQNGHYCGTKRVMLT
jgi:hypothetical protein